MKSTIALWLILLGSALGLSAACVQITCPADIVAGCQGPGGAVVNFAPDPSTTCGTTITTICLPPSGSTFSIGTNLVQCVVEDPRGNNARCEFRVIVTNGPPVITCPSDIVTACQSPSGATATFAPTASAPCGTPVNVICLPPSGSVFPIGTNFVSCVAIDPSSRMARCSFQVVVTNGPPTITCPPPMTLTANANCRGVLPLIPVTVIERCTPSNQLAFAQSPPAGTLLSLGDHTVTVTVSEGAHIAASCTVLVQVVDKTAPVLKCPGSVIAHCAPAGTNVSFKVDATDNCDGPVVVTCDPPSGTFFSSGSTIVTCTASDNAGNSSKCSFGVNVLATPPTITFVGGSKDGYALPADPTAKSACLQSAMANVPTISQFDQNFPGRWLGHSFQNLPGGIESATMRIRMKPNTVYASNDVLRVGLTDCQAGAKWVWAQPIWSLPEANGTWSGNGDTYFTLDLNAMPAGPGAPPNMKLFVLPLLDLDTTHRVDVAIGEDTVVDWIELSIKTCQVSGAAGGVPYAMKRGVAAPGPDGGIRFLSNDRLPFDLDLNFGKADGIEIEFGDWPGATNPPISDCVSPIGSYVPTELEWKPDNQVLCNVKFLPNGNSAYTDVFLTQPTNVSTSGRAIEIWAKGQMVTRYFVKDETSGVVFRDDACLLSMGFGTGEFFMALREPSDIWIVSGEHITGEKDEPFQGDFVRMFFNIPFTVSGGPVVRFDPDLILNVTGRQLDVRQFNLRKLGGLFETRGEGIYSLGDNVATLPKEPTVKEEEWSISTCYTAPIKSGDEDNTGIISLTLAELFAAKEIKPGAAFDVVATAEYGTTPPLTGVIGRLRCEIVSVDPLVTRFRAHYADYGLTTRLSLVDGTFTETSSANEEFELNGAPVSIGLYVNNNFANFVLYFGPQTGDDVTVNSQLYPDRKYAWFRPYDAPPGVHHGPYRFCVTQSQAWENIPITFSSPVPPPSPAPPMTQCLSLQVPSRIVRWSPRGEGVPVRFEAHAESACGTNVTVTCVPPSGSVFPVGVTYVTCHAVDELGYAAHRRFPVTVYEGEPRLLIEPVRDGRVAVTLPAEFVPAEFRPTEFVPAEFLPAEFHGWELEVKRHFRGRSWESLGRATEGDGRSIGWLVPAVHDAQFFRLRAP